MESIILGKRKFSEIEDNVPEVNNGKADSTSVRLPALQCPMIHDKKQASEGFSWWTCMQLGLPMSSSKPQPCQKNK